MRYVLAAILTCAIGAPAASAFPTVSPASVSASKAGSIVQVAKRSSNSSSSNRSSSSNSSGNRSRSQRQSRSGGDGGIHPLVGSGGY